MKPLKKNNNLLKEHEEYEKFVKEKLVMKKIDIPEKNKKAPKEFLEGY